MSLNLIIYAIFVLLIALTIHFLENKYPLENIKRISTIRYTRRYERPDGSYRMFERIRKSDRNLIRFHGLQPCRKDCQGKLINSGAAAPHHFN